MSTPRVAILAGLFVAGGLAGAGGTAVLTAEEDAIDLVAGEQIARHELGPNGGLMITIDVYNPDQRSVSVGPVAIGGWDVVVQQVEAVTAAGQAWTTMSFEVIPDCEGGVEGTFEIVADDVASELELTNEATDMFDLRGLMYCGGDGIVLEPVVGTASWDGDTLVLDVRLPGHGRSGLGDLTIVEASAGVPYMVEAQGLPATLPAEGAITLTTRWTFDCDPDPDDLVRGVGPAGEMPYEAIYLTTSDDILIEADVTARLIRPWGRSCAEAE